MESALDGEMQEKSSEQWRRALKVFDAVKHIDVNSRSIQKTRKYNCRSSKRSPLLQKPSRLNSVERKPCWPLHNDLNCQIIKKVTSEKTIKVSSYSRCNDIRPLHQVLEEKVQQPGFFHSKPVVGDCKENAENKTIEETIIWSSSSDEELLDPIPSSRMKSLSKRFDLSSRSTKSKSMRRCSNKSFKEESEIVWSSSDDEWENQMHIINLSKRVEKKIDYIIETVTDSDDSSSNKRADILNLSDGKIETISENSENSLNPELDLELFIQAIKRDYIQGTIIKKKLNRRKGGYLDTFDKATKRTNADSGFLAYEQREDIVNGLAGIVTQKEYSYGVCLVNANLVDGSECRFILNESLHSVNVGNSILSFVNNADYYTLAGQKIFMQNKVLKG